MTTPFAPLVAAPVAAQPIAKTSAKPVKVLSEKPVANKSVEPHPNYPPLLIGPGDQITITVVGYSGRSGGAQAAGFGNHSVDLPTEYLVDTAGRIFFPYIGEVVLLGKSQSEASQLLMRRLSEYLKYPQVTVLIRSSNSYNVSVLGQVNRPGKYLIRGQATFLSSIAEAGGPAENASLKGAMLIHDGVKSKLDLRKFYFNEDIQPVDPYVYPGDIVFLPKKKGPSLSTIAIFASLVSTGVFLYVNLK